ncbi:carbohydrate ABC transporter permease [Actinomadura nitritigenes]|uniref:carbohydrate ABC transporter permease n=1 Tax=Actinomadura nitritigenes TaxID=134602 RepID=UPI003D8E4EC8
MNLAFGGRSPGLRRSVLKIFRWAAILLLLAFALAPFLWMIRTALSPKGEAYQAHPGLLPSHVTLGNFQRVVTSSTNPFARQFLNTLLVSTLTAVLSLVLGLSGAYALARMRFRGRTASSVLILLIQLFPPVLLAIPLFVVLNRLHLSDSLIGLVIAYSTINVPFTVWVLRGYLESLPADMENAARVDGCTTFGVLYRIVVPVMTPALAAVGVLAFVNAWNEYLLALVLVNDPDKQVLGVGLTSYVSQFATDLPGLFAMATLTSLPVVLLFLFLQRRLVSGLSAGAVK